MPNRWQGIISLLQLTRVALVFTAISNSWLMIFLGYGFEPPGRRNTGLLEDYPLWAFLILGAAAAAGLHTYAIALNDLLDARYDRVFSPLRPIAAGKVGHATAVVLCVTSLVLAVTAALFMGPMSIRLCLIAVVAILFYNAAGKFVPAAGILALGIVRALNMILPNPRMSFDWPVWLTVTHVVACWAIAHQIEGKRPRLHQVGWVGVVGGWAIGTLLLLRWMAGETPPQMHQPGAWVAPLLAAAGFVAVALFTLRHAGQSARQRRDAGATFLRRALLWLIVYDAAWLIGVHLYWQAATHLALLVLAYGSMRGMLVLAHLGGPEPTYRLTPWSASDVSPPRS